MAAPESTFINYILSNDIEKALEFMSSLDTATQNNVLKNAYSNHPEHMGEFTRRILTPALINNQQNNNGGVRKTRKPKYNKRKITRRR